MGPSPRNRLPLWAVSAAASAAALLVLAGVALSLGGRPAVQTAPVTRSVGQVDIGGPFTLTDQTGAVFTEADLQGRPSLIYFGYTFCPDVCPLSLQVMQRALEMLPEDEREQVRPVFISVDPERDTVERLAEYAATPGFPVGLVALTGTVEEVEAAKAEYRIFSARGESAGDFYLVDHTSMIFLMDAQGEFAAAFSHTESPATIAASVEELVG